MPSGRSDMGSAIGSAMPSVSGIVPSLRIGGSAGMSSVFFSRPSSLSRKPIVPPWGCCGLASMGHPADNRQEGLAYIAQASSYHGRALPRKSRTPQPPRRPVQAPKARTTPRDPERTRKTLLVVGGSALLVIAVVLGFLFIGGGSEGATVAAKFREGGCQFQTYSAAPTLRFGGEVVRHVEALPEGYKYKSSPPASGVHANQTTIFGIYDEPVPQLSTVHNLEHGGVGIQYGPGVPEGDIN